MILQRDRASRVLGECALCYDRCVCIGADFLAGEPQLVVVARRGQRNDEDDDENEGKKEEEEEEGAERSSSFNSTRFR